MEKRQYRIREYKKDYTIQIAIQVKSGFFWHTTTKWVDCDSQGDPERLVLGTNYLHPEPRITSLEEAKSKMEEFRNPHVYPDPVYHY